jgi:2-succinyl-5-enolpyruvyl-6-hydroxy-3-cyclohexene-1-carboxylate synthase
MPVRDLDWFMRPRTGLRVIANRGVNGIDGFISTTLGVASVRGSAIALVGDLATLHDQNGFLDARRRDLNAVFVVLNNDGGGIFSFLPVSRYKEFFEPYFGTPQGVDFEPAAAMFGIGYERPGTTNEFMEAYRAACARDGSTLIEVRTDRKENVALHRELLAGISNR